MGKRAKQQLLESMLNIRDNGPDIEKYGICDNVPHVRLEQGVWTSDWLTTAFRSMGLHPCYPIENQFYDTWRDAEEAFWSIGRLWERGTPRGDARYALLDALIERLQKELGE